MGLRFIGHEGNFMKRVRHAFVPVHAVAARVEMRTSVLSDKLLANAERLHLMATEHRGAVLGVYDGESEMPEAFQWEFSAEEKENWLT